MIHGHLKAIMRPKLDLRETALAQVVKLGFKAADVRHIVLVRDPYDWVLARTRFYLSDEFQGRLNHIKDGGAAIEDVIMMMILGAHGAVPDLRDRAQIEAKAADFGVTAMPIPGHTPGHTGYMIASGGEALEQVGLLILVQPSSHAPAENPPLDFVLHLVGERQPFGIDAACLLDAEIVAGEAKAGAQAKAAQVQPCAFVFGGAAAALGALQQGVKQAA